MGWDIKRYESWKSGNIGYIVDYQSLKWQHFGNKVATASYIVDYQ
jgi:hypothetical protein